MGFSNVSPVRTFKERITRDHGISSGINTQRFHYQHHYKPYCNASKCQTIGNKRTVDLLVLILIELPYTSTHSTSINFLYSFRIISQFKLVTIISHGKSIDRVVCSSSNWKEQLHVLCLWALLCHVVEIHPDGCFCVKQAPVTSSSRHPFGFSHRNSLSALYIFLRAHPHASMNDAPPCWVVVNPTSTLIWYLRIPPQTHASPYWNKYVLSADIRCVIQQ